MNRPGQPPQRPPSLAPGPGLGGPFRGPPYPSYGLPPRNVSVLQSAASYVPGLQQPANQRTSQTQGIIPQSTPAPGFLQRGGQSGFPYASGIGGQHQQTTTLQTQPPHSSQQQPNGTTPPNSLPSHIPPPSSNLTGNGAPSVSSSGEVALDPNDFPALGSAPTTNSNNSTTTNGSAPVATSYASQAGTGVSLTGGNGNGAIGGTGSTASASAAGTNSSSQTRDFTPDDFPALGNHSQPPSQSQDHSHPPGLNGFQHNNEHRQNLLGSLAGGSTPGMLHLGGQQGRGVHLGFGQGLSEVEKAHQRSTYPMKLNQATHAAWTSPNPTQTQPQSLSTNPFGNLPSVAATNQNGTHPPNPSPNPNPNQSQSLQPLSAPPSGTNSYQQQQLGQPPAQGPTQGLPHPPGVINNAYASNGDAAGAAPPSPSHQHLTHPQTPAQQILISPADRWGLLGLLAMIKGVGREVDGGLSSVGTDLGTMGLDMSFPGNLYPTFITPWADQSAAHTVEPDFHLPACYSVQAPPPGPNKAAAFSDETLFFMFYSHPRDALQEVSAQELWNRNWRYHKELRLWITKETGTTPSQKVPGGEQGSYTIWDPENWIKERKEMAVLYADLEEKNQPAFVQGPGLVQAQPGAQATGQQQQQQTQTAQGQMQQAQRGTFPMAIGGL